MSYIGKSPAVGNFVKLDAISTSSTNSYSLSLDSVAFVPESANHMLVSLNGVIQAPLTSFSVSGSTITFLPSSGTLSSSDSIDFIMVYGNVLDIGTPSDSTVTNAKTNFVSTSSSAGLQIKGDGTTDGTLQLNCSQNSHGIKLKSPAHSTSSSYTLTFPGTDPSADKFLKTDGSGNLSFANAGGITEFDMYRLTSSITSDTDPIQSNLERVDDATFSKIGTGVTNSSGIFSFPSTGLYQVGHIAQIYPETNDTVTFSIYATANNGGAWDQIVQSNFKSGSSRQSGKVTNFSLVNVTDVSNVKVKFTAGSFNSGSEINGNTDLNFTCFFFMRVGDSQ